MRNRPWPIVILAILYLLGPFFNTVTGAVLMRMSYLDYLTVLYRQPWLEILLAAGLYPVAGVAIYAFKAWSYPIYLAVMAVSVYGNYLDWRHYPGVFSLPVFVATAVFNLALVSYFLIPAVRAAYFNPRLRWWESKPRYVVNVPGTLEALEAESSFKCTIANVSEGGAFIRSARKIDPESDYRLLFSILDQKIDVRAKIVHRLWKGTRGYGVEFEHNDESRKRLARIARGLGLLGVATRNGLPDRWLSFRNWISTLVHTGKGWVPELPGGSAQAPASVVSLKKAKTAKRKKEISRGDRQAA